MNSYLKALVAGAGALALASSVASAEIVCNDEGDCWHVRARHEYRPEFGLHIYPDDWRWRGADARSYRWREHEGRGYWRNGLWIEF